MNAEKKPVSADLETLSITCEGGCIGMAGMGSGFKEVGEKDGVREFTNRLSQIRTT